MKIPQFINQLVLYKPGKPIEETQREYGLKNVYKLASNENPLGPSPKVLKAASEALSSQHIYPDPSQYELVRRAVSFFGLSADCISFGNGTDEIIDFLARIFCEPGDCVLFPKYSFQAYEVTATAQRLNILTSELNGWNFDLDQLIRVFEHAVKKPKIVFLANPNNPTGTIITQSDLFRAIEFFADKECLVVIDEAYIEFVRSKDYQSAVCLLSKYDHLVVLRTFSKIFGMAGFRLGALLSTPHIVTAYNKIRKPFNVSGIAQVGGIAAMDDKEFVKKTQELTWSGLDYFYKEFKNLSIHFVESEGNFVLFDTGRSANAVFEDLLKQGIILRPVGNYGLPNHLRMSVGLEHENKAAIEAIAKTLKLQRGG